MQIPKPGTRTVPSAPSGGSGTTSRRLEATPSSLVAATGSEPRAVHVCGAPIPARMQAAREPCHDHWPPGGFAPNVFFAVCEQADVERYGHFRVSRRIVSGVPLE